MNINEIRKDFEFLNKEINGKPIVYFDNACMTLAPNQVLEKMNWYYKDNFSCAGRSNNKIAEKVNYEIDLARKEIAEFINAKSSREIIFTRNTTEGINLIANSFDFKKGDLVLITDKEHNSNLIPWQNFRDKKGIEIGIIKSNEDGSFDFENFKKLLEKKPKMVSIVYTSNLDGVRNEPMKDIVKNSHEVGAKVLIDAAQTIGHEKIDVKNLDVDFMAFSGHKMLGPTGTGVLYCKIDEMEKLSEFLVGGGAVAESSYENHIAADFPEKFEAGLQNYAGIIGLGEAVRYLKKISFDNIYDQELKINKKITEFLSGIEGVKIIGPKEAEKRPGIINFYHNKLDAFEISAYLDKMGNIMARVGQHCVHSWFKSRGIKNSCRLSFYFYNTEEEADVFIETFKKILKLI